MRIKCDCCGKFVRPNQPGVSWVFVPDAGLPGDYEEDAWRCVTCTKSHGQIMPAQRGLVLEQVCGIISDEN
jgi:hypothetical protein